jgi:hypothetical protein
MKKGMRTLAMVGLGGGLGLGALVAGPARVHAQQGNEPQQESAPAQPAPMPAPEPQPAQPAPGGAEPQAAPGAEEAGRPGATKIAETTNITATVEKVDLKNRKLSLRDPQGQRLEVQVPSEVTGLENLKKGDKIDITYSESLAMALLPPGQAAPRPEERTATGSQMGAAGAARQITAAVTITKVDQASNTVSFKEPDGSMRTVKVQDPEMQQRLADLKPGDVVQLTYTEAVAARLAPHAQKKAQ